MNDAVVVVGNQIKGITEDSQTLVIGNVVDWDVVSHMCVEKQIEHEFLIT